MSSLCHAIKHFPVLRFNWALNMHSVVNCLMLLGSSNENRLKDVKKDGAVQNSHNIKSGHRL